ncbi:MAG: CDP-2,3-bis-(O-geranylgeranyl)-sn-glycerol synthase [Candidatus Njordarchaeia archaeon]
MIDMLDRIINLIIFILPAYVANGAPVIFGGGKPIDLGKNFFDGRRIFGDHKTIRGLVSGLLAGSFIGFLIFLFDPNSSFNIIIQAFIMSLGAHCGDLFGSFIKRRINLKPGQSAPILDQLGFLYFALLFVILICNASIDLIDLVILTILTLLLHPLTNLGAYLLKLKREPY